MRGGGPVADSGRVDVDGQRVRGRLLQWVNDDPGRADAEGARCRENDAAVVPRKDFDLSAQEWRQGWVSEVDDRALGGC
jgi:hypothetical protein